MNNDYRLQVLLNFDINTAKNTLVKMAREPLFQNTFGTLVCNYYMTCKQCIQVRIRAHVRAQQEP